MIRPKPLLAFATAMLLAGATQGAQSTPAGHARIRAFLGEGTGQMNGAAPPQLAQFGQLAGVWTTAAQVRRQDGSWANSAPGIWAWKYVLDGFAVSDLFLHPADGLPDYMADLGRDYLLTANRMFDVRAGHWRVAWMANGGGQVMGEDFGTFSAEWVDGQIIMSAPGAAGGFGLQRIVFADFSDAAFSWRSEYSRDEGQTWVAVMKIQATRVE